MSTADKKQIRLKVIGIFRKQRQILAVRVLDPLDGRTIYVPPGGGVEFGEDTVAALRREMQEELRAAVEPVALLGVLENRFTFAGNSAHEIVFVYHARFSDASRYAADTFAITESDGTPFEAVWVDFTATNSPAVAIRPEGLTTLLEKLPSE